MTRPAPLLDIAEAPVPKGGQAEWFTGAKGATLRAALFPATGLPKGSVVLSGGRTEPIEKYYEVIRDLTGRGFTVLAHDWRGQGLSQRLLPDRLKGHAAGHADFMADYQALLARFESRLPKPWVAMAHSMGGCLTMLVLTGGETRFSAAVLSAPMLGLPLGGRPFWTARAMAAVQKLIGRSDAYMSEAAGKGGGGAAPFEDQVLTHDKGRYDTWMKQLAANPDLDLGGVTWGWVDFALSSFAWMRAPGRLEKVTIPVVILSAGEEKLVWNPDARMVAGRLPKGKFLEVPGSYHEILMETDDKRAVFWREFDAVAASL